MRVDASIRSGLSADEYFNALGANLLICDGGIPITMWALPSHVDANLAPS